MERDNYFSDFSSALEATHIDKETAPTYLIREETDQTDQWNEVLKLVKEYSKNLNIRQKKVLILYCSGYSFRDISIMLSIKESDIYWYKKRIVEGYIKKLIYDRRLPKIIRGMSPFFRKKIEKWIEFNQKKYKIEVIECPICQEKFKSKNEFRIHVRWRKRHHPGYNKLIRDQNEKIDRELIANKKWNNKWATELSNNKNFYFSKSYIFNYCKGKKRGKVLSRIIRFITNPL